MCNFISRYTLSSEENNFSAPSSLTHDDGCCETYKLGILMSITSVTQEVITNTHNTLMASKTNAFLKFGGIVLLEVANLVNTAFAIAETIVRLALSIIAMPFLFINCSEPLTKMAEIVIKVSLPITALTIPGGLYQAWDMLSSTKNIKNGSENILAMIGYTI